MNRTWAPESLPAATRGEFLAHRATAVPELERRLSSLPGLLVNYGRGFGAFIALMMAGSALSDVRVETFHVVFAIAMVTAALGTVPFTVRWARSTGKLMETLVSWEAAERQTRSLATGDVQPELRMPFDARRDADFEHVAHSASMWAEFRPIARRLFLRAAPAIASGALGIALVLGGPGTEPAAQGIAFVLSGIYLLTWCLAAVVGVFTFAWRLTMVWRAQDAEIRAWRVERVGAVAAAQFERAQRRERARMVAPYVAVAVLVLVVRMMTSSPVAVASFVAIVVLAGLLIGVVLLARRSRRRAAAPAAHDLTSVPPD
jgi:hypothetical protein